jgi:uncharacterized membrane protein
MEEPMRDLALQLAGVVAVFAAIVHGVLGETRVFSRAQIDPPWARRLMRAVWHCGVVAWIGGGVLLMAAPSFASDGARRWVVVVLAAAVFGSAAIGNAVATRGRHFGWAVLSAVVVLALVGI